LLFPLVLEDEKKGQQKGHWLLLLLLRQAPHTLPV